ncbi:MAG: hypothetical protein OXU68_04250 [Bacteroidota bacterium]|nr:hypothetical protein [Bacteroidota bacterium]
MKRAAALSRFRKELWKGEHLAFDRSIALRKEAGADLNADLDDIRQALVDFVHDVFNTLPERYQDDFEFQDSALRSLKEAIRCTRPE